VKNIFITGATGFLGSNLAEHFSLKGSNIRYVTRGKKLNLGTAINVEDLDSIPFWEKAIGSSGVIIHCMARVHVMNEVVSDPYPEFKRINVDATLALANAAKNLKVSKFFFISTVGVYGNSGTGISEKSPIVPNGPYAQTKYEAEQELQKIFKDTSTELIILRPPLIYGKNAPGNFRSLEKVISKHIPLPLGLVSNKRSFIYVKNLNWYIEKMMLSAENVSGVYNVADDETVSTAYFLKSIASHFKLSFIVPFPIFILRILGKLTGKSKAVSKLTADLSFEVEHICGAIGHRPPFKMKEALTQIYES
jgi:nucleoside-diphosphate-sugar epimerase